MSVPGSAAKSKRHPPFEDASESDGEMSSNEMPDLLLDESERGEFIIDQDGSPSWVAEDVLCGNSEGEFLIKWKGFYLGESTWEPWTNLDRATRNLWLEKEKGIKKNLVEAFDPNTWVVERDKVLEIRERRLKRLAKVKSDESEERIQKQKLEAREQARAERIRQVEQDINGHGASTESGQSPKKSILEVDSVSSRQHSDPSPTKVAKSTDPTTPPSKRRKLLPPQAPASEVASNDASKISKSVPETAKLGGGRTTPDDLGDKPTSPQVSIQSDPGLPRTAIPSPIKAVAGDKWTTSLVSLGSNPSRKRTTSQASGTASKRSASETSTLTSASTANVSSTTRQPKTGAAQTLDQVAQGKAVSSLKPNTNPGLSNASKKTSMGVKGPIAFTDKPAAKKRRWGEEPQMFNRISHQYYINKRAARDHIDSAESATLYKFVDGKRIIEQAAPATSGTQPKALNKTPVAISISQDREKLAAKKNQQHSKPPGFIPLTCPFIVENQPCQKLTSCFFQHAKMDPPRNASYRLFQQAEEESVYPGPFVYKFGFFPSQEALTCKHWPNCHNSDDTCWYAHWPTGETKMTEQWTGRQKTMICWFWANESHTRRPCWKREKCAMLHEWREGCQVSPQPKSWQNPKMPDKLDRARQALASTEVPHNKLTQAHRTSNPAKNRPPHTAKGEPPSDEEVPMELETEDEAATVQDEPLPRPTVASPRVDVPLALEVQGKTFHVVINVSVDVLEFLPNNTPVILECGMLAEHFEDFFDHAQPLCFGPVDCIDESFPVLAETLRLNLQGAVASVPAVDLLFVPGGQDTWTFLPAPTDTKVHLKYYMYKKGLWPATPDLRVIKHVDGKHGLDLFDMLDRMIPGGHKTFFAWFHKDLDRNIFLADTGDDWSPDKEVWTRFFREAGAAVYHDYTAFKAETKSGAFILPPSLHLSVMRAMPDVRDFLWSSYNFFYLGYDDRGAFACEKLFSRGSTVLLTRETYKHHPGEAIAIVKNLRERIGTADKNHDKITWKLAGPPNLMAWLGALRQSAGTPIYTDLQRAVGDLRDAVDAAGAPRAFVELGGGRLDASATAADDGAADAAAAESLGVWSYGHDEGALVSRRSVVVCADAGRLGAGAAARAAFQNVFFMPVAAYVRKFMRPQQQVAPAGAAAAAASAGGGGHRAPVRSAYGATQASP